MGKWVNETVQGNLDRNYTYLLATFSLSLPRPATATAKSLQSCPTLCDPIDGSPPGSAVLGILQARILEWVAMPSFKESSQPRDQIRVSCIARWILSH